MNILLLGINYAPEPTGIGKYQGEFGAYLAAKGHKVSAITGFPYYPHWELQKGYRIWWWQKEQLDGVNVSRCPLFVPSNPTGMTRMMQDLSFFITSLLAITKQIIVKKRYNTILIASPSFMSGWVGLWYKIWYPTTKVIYHIHDMQIDAAEELELIKNKTVLRLLKKAEGNIISKVTAVSTISPGMMVKIKAKPYTAKRYLMLPNWVSNEYIFPCTPPADMWQKFGVPPYKKVIFYSGAMGKKQGLEIVLELAVKAKQIDLDWFFVLAGSGPFAASLAQQADAMQLNNTIFIPLQSLEIFNRLLNAAWVQLVVQKEEAADLLLPSKLTNILAVGGLALVTANPGTTLYEEVKTHKIGIITKPGNLNEMWTALNEIEKDPLMEKELRENAEQYANQYLKKENIISKFIEDVESEMAVTRQLQVELKMNYANNKEING